MSVLIMSIGVISVATLFPVSLLRSVQATHLTHATRFRYNIESLLDLHPNILGQIQVPTHGVQRVVIDPMGFALIDADIASGSPPPPPTGSPFTLAEHQTIFGWNAGGGGGLPRFTYFYDFDRDGDVDQFDMDQLVTLPDSFIEQAEYLNQAGPSISVDNTTNTLTVTNADVAVLTNLAGTLAPLQENTRVTVYYDYQGRGTSEARTVGAINPAGQTITWIGPPLPAAEPTFLRLEMTERRYTWMLTVRKRKDGRGQEVSDVDAVIFARRPFSLDDEEMVEATFTQGSQVVQLTGATPRFLKKGRFVFDVQNSLWYRVLDVNDAQTVIKIDRPAVENALNGQAMFMRGVVDVYRLPTFIREGAP